MTDPVGQGLVSNLAYPGGNITGFTNFEFSIGTKWLEALKEVAPRITRVAVIFNAETAPFAELFWRPVEYRSCVIRGFVFYPCCSAELGTENVLETREKCRHWRGVARKRQQKFFVIGPTSAGFHPGRMPFKFLVSARRGALAASALEKARGGVVR